MDLSAQIAASPVCCRGMGHGGDELAAEQVVRECHDWDTLGCFLCSARCFGPGYHEHIWPRFGQLYGDRLVRQPRPPPCRDYQFQDCGLPQIRLGQVRRENFAGPARAYDRNPIMLPSHLRACSKRPYRRHAAQTRNEFTPSITGRSPIRIVERRILTACDQRDEPPRITIRPGSPVDFRYEVIDGPRRGQARCTVCPMIRHSRLACHFQKVPVNWLVA